MRDPVAPPASFESLLSSVLNAAFAAALHITRNRTDAEDLVQEAAFQAFKNFHQFEPGTRFKAWFLRILTNCFLSRQRKKKREGQTLDIDDAPELYLFSKSLALDPKVADPATLVVSKLETEHVTEAIASLPEEFRVVAALYFVEDLSYREIADMVDCPVGTVRSRLHRARRLLQKALWDVAEARGLVPSASAGKETP